MVKVQVRQVFPNCPRYIHKMQMVERSPFVPRADVTPVPGWKRMEWSGDVLPKNDPALKVILGHAIRLVPLAGVAH